MVPSCIVGRVRRLGRGSKRLLAIPKKSFRPCYNARLATRKLLKK